MKKKFSVLGLIVLLLLVPFGASGEKRKKKPLRFPRPGGAIVVCKHGSSRVLCEKGYAPEGQCLNGIPMTTCIAPTDIEKERYVK